MKQNHLETIRETFEDFKCLLPRYISVKKDSNLRKKFCTRNRNPLWDISNMKYFKTGLGSEKGLSSLNPVEDHFIQRSKAIDLIFNEIEKDPEMTLERFIKVLKKYCSVVCLTKEEHSQVTSFCKKNKEAFNYEAYLACGIKVSGLSDLILAN